jgi:hypothetical protein
MSLSNSLCALLFAGFVYTCVRSTTDRPGQKEWFARCANEICDLKLV